MKMTLALAVVAAGAVTLATNVMAGSPKGDSLAQSLETIHGSTAYALDHSGTTKSPKAWSNEESLRSEAISGPTEDLANAPLPTLSPKDPRFESALRMNAMKQMEVQIAPLK